MKGKKTKWSNLLFFLLVNSLFVLMPFIFNIDFSILFNGKFLILMSLIYLMTVISICAGFHRLYSHRSYKSHWILDVFYLFMGSSMFNGTIKDWALDHQDHHKYIDTEKDPAYIENGFFYAHMGWLCVDRDYTKVNFNYDKDFHKIYDENIILISLVTGILIPFVVFLLFFSEMNLLNIFYFSFIFRIIILQHSVLTLSSLNHFFGKNYGKNISARNNWFVNLITLGDGYHFNHHVKDHTYKGGSPSVWFDLNRAFIELCFKLKIARK